MISEILRCERSQEPTDYCWSALIQPALHLKKYLNDRNGTVAFTVSFTLIRRLPGSFAPAWTSVPRRRVFISLGLWKSGKTCGPLASQNLSVSSFYIMLKMPSFNSLKMYSYMILGCHFREPLVKVKGKAILGCIFSEYHKACCNIMPRAFYKLSAYLHQQLVSIIPKQQCER